MKTIFDQSSLCHQCAVSIALARCVQKWHRARVISKRAGRREVAEKSAAGFRLFAFSEFGNVTLKMSSKSAVPNHLQEPVWPRRRRRRRRMKLPRQQQTENRNVS